MLPRHAYLAWAVEHFGGLAYDLASSGLASAPASMLGDPPRLDDPGAEAAFEALVAARYGVPVGEVTTALGTSGALWLTYAGLFSPGDEIVIERPAYEPVVRVAEGAGLSVRRFDRDRSAGWALDVDRALAATTPKTRAVVVTDLHNPTSAALDPDRVRALAASLADRGALVIVDEVYRELHAPASSLRGVAPNVVAVSSLTKAFGLGWLRAGFVLAPASLRPRLANAILHAAGNFPTVSFALGAEAMRRLGAFESRRRELQDGKRARVDAWLAARSDRFTWVPPPPGAQFGYVTDRRGPGVRARLEAGVSREGVLAVPGGFFDAGDDGFRIGWTCPTDRLDEGLERLARVLEA